MTTVHPMNPFLSTYNTPHQTTPFDQISLEDYEPAFRAGMAEEDDEIRQIVENPAAPSFENTIIPFERSGQTLARVSTVFFNLLSAETNDEMDALAQSLSPVLTEHENNIMLNEALFQRIKTVYEQEKENAGADAERKMLVNNIYDAFIRNGANLDEQQKATYRQLTEQLALLSLQFSQNRLKEINAFQLHVTDESDLEGLPESAVSNAREEARNRQLDGWVFTLQAPCYNPFMTYSSRRDLREKMYMAYNTICTHDNENNNQEIVRQIVDLHRQLAQLLGYRTYADYTLRKRMAENTENVYELLNRLLEAYRPQAEKEVEAVRQLCDTDLQPWDFAYYSNQLKERDFNLNSEMLRPYFELSNVKEGVFSLANKLYGITFRRNEDIPVYHPDVEAYEVFDVDGSYLAVLYCDFHPRSGKKPGAWMTNYKEQWKESGPHGEIINSRPHVSITTNFTKPTASKPSLLTLGEVETFLHEFGHTLHGMFADTTYRSLSGTNVYWDFVELPSQFMENYAIEKEFLHTFARHYQTGELIPDELVDRVVRSRNFNVAYSCLRQLSFGFLDMAYYTQEQPFTADIMSFEQAAMQSTRLLPHVPGTNMSVQFSHIMSGGYSAGYYSYKWAEVLDADAFALFQQNGIFDRDTANSFRNNILSKGGTEPPMQLYIAFRHQRPTIDALLRRNGMIKPS